MITCWSLLETFYYYFFNFLIYFLLLFFLLFLLIIIYKIIYNYNILRLLLMSDNMLEFIRNFLILFFELLALFILVSIVVSLIKQSVSEEKIQQLLNRPNKALNYFLGVFFGAITPFCSCSTVPILAGLLNAKVPFGPSISFLIASPLMNPIVVVMLWVLLGWKITV